MKRKDITSALSGIVGRNLEKAETKKLESVTPITENPITENDPDITSDMVENLNALRKKNVGRPKLREVRERENRATFVMPKEIVNKMKYISLLDGRLLKDVAAEAFEQYIARWEKKRNNNNKIEF